MKLIVMQQAVRKLTFIGAQPQENGVFYRVWAPKRGRVRVQIEDCHGDVQRIVRLGSDAGGYFSGQDEAGRAGDFYKFIVDDRGAFPDPASRFQPRGVHGPSMVMDSRHFPWSDQQWRIPPFRDFVIYELHTGTFTQEGTFSAATEKLEYLRDLGVTAVEIMPIADFAGDRNWGYDGVLLFAPSRAYGPPDDLRRLVDRAHQVGLAVILDVVYNHFGPSGCYLTRFSDEYFDRSIHTPWGAAINYSGSEPVRNFLLQNVSYWIEEFHIDAFRLDATHAIIDHSEPHILAELTRLIHAKGRYVIAEDERNDNRVVLSRVAGGLQMDAVWADDFHHAIDTILIESSAFKQDFTGEQLDLVTALQHGWLFRGDRFAWGGDMRGTECAHLPPTCFIFCISNHDQSGNRALGERPHQLVPRACYRAASALLCLSPYMPLLFMGQEWAASTPFLFFTDHDIELGPLIEKGRIAELRTKPIPLPVNRINDVPRPQALSTFTDSKLRWEELEMEEHRQVLELYRELLKIRREHPNLRPCDRAGFTVGQLNFGPVAIRFKDVTGDWLVICDLKGGSQGNLLDEPFLAGQRKLELWLDSNEKRFGGGEVNTVDLASGFVCFEEAAVLLLKSSS